MAVLPCSRHGRARHPGPRWSGCLGVGRTPQQPRAALAHLGSTACLSAANAHDVLPFEPLVDGIRAPLTPLR